MMGAFIDDVHVIFTDKANESFIKYKVDGKKRKEIEKYIEKINVKISKDKIILDGSLHNVLKLLKNEIDLLYDENNKLKKRIKKLKSETSSLKEICSDG